MPEVAFTQPLGQITLRGDLSDPTLRATVEALTGGPVPDRLRLNGTSQRGAALMSPDELLLFLPREEVQAALSRLDSDLAGTHFLAADVSDLRACIALQGEGAREVLAKLSPADLSPSAFGPGDFRRTRLGQIAAGIWLEGQGARVVCFRSVADYALALLRQSAADGAVGYF